MLVEHHYKDLEDWKSKVIEECCDRNPDDDPGGDCCYDTWLQRLQKVNTEFNQVNECAIQLKDQLSAATVRRDTLKKWYDELTAADELARKICDQLSVVIIQTQKVGTNTMCAVEAIEILFCMIRDFYMQVDYIQERYNQLINCIKCLNSSILVPGEGLYKCLEDYYVKLEAVIKTRDELIKKVIKALKLASQINSSIGGIYGYIKLIEEWYEALNCDENCGCPEDERRSKTSQGNSDDNCEDECELKPMISFPICNDDYYNELFEKLKKDETTVDSLKVSLREKNKEKEGLLACKQSLDAAIKEVDPKNRCK